MAEWDVIGEERVATPPAPRPQRNQAAADPWAVVDQFDPNEGVGAEAQGVARPSSLGDTIFNALTRGWERAKSGFQSFDDALQLRGEAASRKSLGEILSQGTPRPDPGSAMMSGLGIILDLVQKGGRAVTSMVEGEDAVAANDQAARAELARLGVRQALAADANPSSALADQIGRLNTGSFLGDVGEAGQLIFGDGVLEGVQRLGALALEYGAESLPGSLPGMAGAIGGGLFGGLPGAVGGGAAGFGSSSAAQQYGLTVLEFLDGRGVNVRDAAAVEEALADPQILQQALDYAGTKTGISASAEALAGAVGPGMLVPRRLVGSALRRELANALVAQPIAQGAIGTAGDVGADMAVGEDPRIAAALIQNVLGEAALSPMETIGARSAARARERAESKADAERAAKAAGFTPVDEAPDLGRPAPADPAPPPAGPAPQAPGDVMAGAAAPDLTPRQPPAAAVPEGTSREQLVEDWRNAATPDERAAAAARIAAYDAQQRDAGVASDLESGGQDESGMGGRDTPAAVQRRDAEDLGDAGVRGSPGEGGPAYPGIRAGVQADSADGQAGARAVPGELPPADPGAAEGQAPRMVRDAPAGLTDPYQDTDDPAIREALGSAAAGITVHRTISDIRPEDRERIGLTENDTDVEGFYDPDTGRVHIIEANLATEGVDPETGERWTMTRDQRRVWVAAHERSGHAGTRGMFAAAEGSNAAGSQALARELDRASQNEVIAAIVAAMERQRPERGRILVEEAIVEIAAAVRTGDYGHIQQRYGVEVPSAARAGLRGTIARLVEAIKRAFGRVGRGFSDADIYRLIEGAHRYAQRGEVRGTSRRAEQQRGPVAQRAYHGTRTRGIDRFSLDKIGTGEGNQSFGWGLYFAGEREVADHYRRGLSAVSRKAGGALADKLLQRHGSPRTALEVISRMRKGSVAAAEMVVGERRWSVAGRKYGLSASAVEANMREELSAAESFIRADNNRGQLYQQELPEDHELLNYDAPLDKQPEKVRAAIERLLPPDAQERLILTRNPRGVDYYNAIGRHISEQKYGFPFPAGEDINMAREASLALAAEGVPGLRYLNGESRSADGGIDPGPTAYNYVIWDESRIGTPEPLIASRASRLLRNLTPEEQRKVTDKVAAKIEAQLTKLPPKREMAAAAIAGQAKRGWYRQSAETISAVFGPDAPLFAGLLAATSPQISVEGNLKNALAIWRDWIAAGRPTGEDEILSVMRSSLRRSFGGSLRAWEPNVVRALQGRGILSGPKVNSFMRNLLGDVEEVTNDAWMANFANVSQTIFKGAINVRETDPGKGAGYLAMNARVREVARELTRLTGETWTPAEVQETIWSWAKTITEMADSAGEIRSAEELVLDRAVTDELIASTPDFGTLFTMPEYRQILEEAGYGDQLEQVSAQRDAARAAGQEPGARRKASPFAEEDQLRLERRAARRIDALRRARREAAAVEEEGADEVPFSRGEPGRFEPLPGAPKIKGATGPDKRLVRIAERYARENGIELRRQREYVKADPERGARIAEAYEAMEHAPNDPRVRAAYEELIRQTVAQYRALEDAGYRFWFADPDNDPYQGNPWNAMRDLRANQSMAVFPTVAGFGSGATDIDVSDNPLMADTGIRWPWGTPDGELRPVLANDLFRAVHDAFGHGLEGAGFRADGEENAWQAHVRLFTGDAVAAITTETRGQNSWLNFGPYGERNRTASVEDTVFADQKTGLMPEWTWTEGRADDEGFVASRGFSAKKRQPDAVSVDAYHYSTQEGLKRLDPARAGSAGAGRERRRFGMGQFGQHGGTAARVNFYVREPGEDIPQPEDVVRDAGATHLYRVQLDNLYDADNDPRGIVENAINADEMEEEISDAGFDGIYYRNPPGIDQPVAVVFDIGKKKIPVEPVEEGVIASRGARNPQIDTPEFRRWFGDSKVVDENGEPLVVYHGTTADFDTFMRSKLGSATGARSTELGFYFTDNPFVANVFAGRQDGGNVMPVYLSLQNPLVIGHLSPEDRKRGFEPFEAMRNAITKISGKESWGDVTAEDVVAWRERLEERGYDGIILLYTAMDGLWTARSLKNPYHHFYIAFEPEQIKSATGNRGTFDPSNPSIIASRRTPDDARRERNSLFGRLAAAGYRMGNATQPQQQTGGRFVRLQYAADNVRTALQDKMLPLLRAQERVAENGPAVTSVTLDDAMNAYRMENLMHGAVKNGLDRVHQSYIQPIQDAIRKSPFTMAMFEDYLYAKAAPERNAEIAKINPAMPDSGSGISTRLAKDILSGAQPGAISGEVLTAGARALFAQLEPLVRKMRDEVLDNMVSAGQITPALADQLRKKYPNYIPMRGKDGELDESRPARGRGISQPRSSGLRRALGRGDTNVPQNIMGELVGDLQRSIVAKEKGKVARAMLRFAMAHPQPDLYTVEPVDLEWKFSEATGEAYLGVKRRGEDVDSSMIVMHEGKPVYLRFVDPALRDAVLNMSVNDMTAMARWLGWINRWRSAVLTRYNPAFTPVNMFRDLQFGLVAVAAELGAAAAARTAKLYPGAMRAAFRHASRQRGDASKPNAQKSMDDWAAEFYETGASTGLTHVDDVVNLQRRLVAASSSVMELAAGGRPIAAVAETLRRVGGPIVDAIENANEASENAIRLAVYIEQRQRGISRDRAAEYAKNVTINFNRKGNATNFLNALYLFFNAAMQGSHAVIRVLRNRKVQAYLAGLAGLQGLLAAQMMGDDDDDGITDWDAIPDYVKRTSLIIPINGGEDYFALPMPYGFNVFTYLGGRGTQRMMLGDRPTDSSVLLDLLKATTEAFSPVPFQDGYRSLFGDQIGFMMGLAANTDDFGSPITQRDPFPDYPVPAALEGKVTTPRAYHVAAQMLAKLGGADLDERIPPVGYLDVAPEQLEAVVEYFGGGLANLANRGVSWMEQMSAGNLDGAYEVVSRLPIASRMIGHVDPQREIASRYYGERGEFKRHRDIVSQRLEGGASLEEAVADRPPEYVAGMQQARYKRSGRTQTGRRYRRGQPRTDAAGIPVVEETEGHAGLALKAAEKRVREINKAIRRIRAGDMTNDELVDLYVERSRDFQDVGLRDERYTGGHPDLGLPNDYIRDVKAPARVRNRAIAILQELREAHQQRFLQHLERDRRRGDEQ